MLNCSINCTRMLWTKRTLPCTQNTRNGAMSISISNTGKKPEVSVVFSLMTSMTVIQTKSYKWWKTVLMPSCHLTSKSSREERICLTLKKKDNGNKLDVADTLNST
ncbi:Hem13 [Kluyveromyces lactis]|nr:Hem13 [Kluyveromyces lactis]